MRASSWIQPFRAHSAELILTGLLVLLWQLLQMAANYGSDQTRATISAQNAIGRASGALIRPGDTIFVSSADPDVREALRNTGGTIYDLEPSELGAAGSAIEHVLDGSCARPETVQDAAIYWIWTDDSGREPVLLGEVARLLGFHFSFQAVLPNRGDDAFAIDKFLRLHPRDSLLGAYCAARQVAAGRPAMVVLGADAYSPWIRPLKLGNLTWLSGSPQRYMADPLFEVQDMPPLLTYDVHWVGMVWMFPTWTFFNQDAVAYAQAVDLGKRQLSLVLVDQGITLSAPATQYIQECSPATPPIEHGPLRQMCFK